MIKYSNIKKHVHIPFNEYVKMDGFSFSYLKREVNGVAPYMEITDKIRLGSLVDGILMQPDEVNMLDPQYNKAVQIAREIKSTFGQLIERFNPQISYTATASFNGLCMPVCGRLDWELEGLATIDLKVTEASSDKQFRELIKYMGYENQLWNYSKMAGVKRAYIMPFSTKLNKCLSIFEVPLPDRNEFWEEKIMKFGTVC